MTVAIDNHLSMEPDEWRENSACRGLGNSIFFTSQSKSAEAKRICATCPVIGECLDYAVRTDQPDGVWGGLTYKERKVKYPNYIRDAMREDFGY